MSQPLPDSITDEEPLHPIDIVRDILRNAETLPRLMEFHYLIQEPGLLEIMRGLGSLSDADRSQLRHYLSSHADSPLRVRQRQTGELTLESAPTDGSG